MAYADQQMSGNRITAIVVVVLIHVAVGYVLVTGLAYDAFQQVVKHVTTVDVKEPDKTPPPPPPKASKARGASPKNLGSWSADIKENLSSDAVREGSGVVGMSITIGADGRVQDCTPSHSSGKPGLDRSACAGMKRFARYTPALNDDGNPIASTTTQTIRFDLTDSE